jgi:hypothetical protein
MFLFVLMFSFFGFWFVCVWTLGIPPLVYVSHLSLIQKHFAIFCPKTNIFINTQSVLSCDSCKCSSQYTHVRILPRSEVHYLLNLSSKSAKQMVEII